MVLEKNKEFCRDISTLKSKVKMEGPTERGSSKPNLNHTSKSITYWLQRNMFCQWREYFKMHVPWGSTFKILFTSSTTLFFYYTYRVEPDTHLWRNSIYYTHAKTSWYLPYAHSFIHGWRCNVLIVGCEIKV